MKLDSRAIRYLTADDWRVLTAVEMGARNHDCVPSKLISEISGLRSQSGVNKSVSTLAKVGLIGRLKNAKYDGYRLTYGGLDYLALNAHRKHETLFSVGTRVGVGKESDIYVAAGPRSGKRILKIHRLGRISFRQVKKTRDYLRGRSTKSWMYMSRLAAIKEHAFMVALKESGFDVPEPLGQNRHTVVMSLIDATPLRQISSVPDPAGLMDELIAIAIRLAQHGLIHGDYNEFNILIEEILDEGSSFEDENAKIKLRPVVIDFPQMVSIDHPNAEYYFDRDIACIKRFFERRFHLINDTPGPTFAEAIKGVQDSGFPRLDYQVEASGFSRKMAKELEAYMKEVGVDGVNEQGDGADDGQEEGEGEDNDELERSENEGSEAEDDGLCGSGDEMAIPLADIDIPEPIVPVTLDDVAPPKEDQTQKKKKAGWAI